MVTPRATTQSDRFFIYLHSFINLLYLFIYKIITDKSKWCLRNVQVTTGRQEKRNRGIDTKGTNRK